MARRLSPLLLCAIALAGCLGRGGSDEDTRVRGNVLTVYSSLPHEGASAPVARSVAAGERRALADAGGRAGGFRVRLVQLDSTQGGDRVWEPGIVSANAKRAADDPKTIAYLGDLDYGASAVSLPITNDAGILQVSPGDTLTSLTRTTPGRPRAGPDRYYPTGEHTFLRLVPNDLLQAETILERARDAGARRMAIVYDAHIYGRELAGELAARGRRDGPEPVGAEEFDGKVESVPDLVRKLAESSPDTIVYAGIADRGTGPLLAEIDRRMPAVPAYVTGGLLARDPDLPIPAAPGFTEAFGPVPPASEMPPKGRRLLRSIARQDGRDVARPQALYGYEAMRIVLDAVAAGAPDRHAVVEAALSARTRDSVIGRYGIRATGDVDTERFATWRLVDGSFRFTGMTG
ncbi:MAG TPA: ABC transporter substrate-binding protein [Thermoleophilaceae bacterium]